MTMKVDQQRKDWQICIFSAFLDGSESCDSKVGDIISKVLAEAFPPPIPDR